MDHFLLIASTFCFLLAFCHTVYALRAGSYRASTFNFSAIACGFFLQSAFLFQRGHALGRCPLTNLFEVFIFLSWSVVLLYLVIGPAYRLSLLGAFTSPLVFLLQAFALLAPLDSAPFRRVAPNPWIELHAAVSVVACGAFALAGVAGVMYLAQEWQLKTRRLRSIFFHLPPITDLAKANSRLLRTGFGLLTVGLLAGFAVRRPLDWEKAAAVCVWLLYGAMLLADKRHSVGPHRVALFSVLAFSLTMSMLWGINFISEARPL